MTVSWSGNGKTTDPLFDTATSTAASARVSVRTGTDGAATAQTLLYSTGLIGSDRIRYVQTAFDEYQSGDAAVLQEGALFYASTASNSAFITAARQGGHVVRGWDFDSASYATTPLANYPATNHPSDSWYINLLTQSGAVS